MASTAIRHQAGPVPQRPAGTGKHIDMARPPAYWPYPAPKGRRRAEGDAR